MSKLSSQRLRPALDSQTAAALFAPLRPDLSPTAPLNFLHPDSGAFVVCTDTYVTDDSGTGIVHQAPAYGEDDFRVCLAHGVLQKGEAPPDATDENGRFLPGYPWVGKTVKEADKEIILAIKALGRLVDHATLVHSYPFCWRSATPLIYKAVPSYFVHVEAIKDKLVANNDLTYWYGHSTVSFRSHMRE